MSRPQYEVWLGEGRGTLLAPSFERAKGILRRHFKGPVYLSAEYRTDKGVGWTAYSSAKERADDPWGWSAAKQPSIERIAQKAVKR